MLSQSSRDLYLPSIWEAAATGGPLPGHSLLNVTRAINTHVDRRKAILWLALAPFLLGHLSMTDSLTAPSTECK